MADKNNTPKPLEDLSLPELHEKLESLGFSNPKILATKKQAVEVIKDIQLRSQTTDALKDNKKEDRKRHQSKKEIMREHLAKQPKVQVFLPLEGKEVQGDVKVTIVKGREVVETKGATFNVTFNGYTTTIPKGKPWSVPQQVAEKLGQSQTETANAGKHMLLDRDDEVQKALS